jgi:hypothetical protein
MFKLNTNQLLIAGMSSCIVVGKLFILMNRILNNYQMELINFIYSIGQATAQIICPFVVFFLSKYFCLNSLLILIGALMLHILPLTMAIAKDGILIRMPTSKLSHKNSSEESRYSDVSAISFDFCSDIKYPSDAFDMENKWKNPNSFKDSKGSSAKGDNFLEELDSHRIMNSEGVEILQTILEDDEEMEIKFPDTVTVEDNELSDDAIESIYEEINRKHGKQEELKTNSCIFMKTFLFDKYQRMSTAIYRQIFNPFRRSLKMVKFYPSVILKSCDVFSYLLFITLILPNVALKQYGLQDQRKIIYLIMLMGFTWIVYAVLVLKFHNRLKQNGIQYIHIVGILGKFFGYLCGWNC